MKMTKKKESRGRKRQQAKICLPCMMILAMLLLFSGCGSQKESHAQVDGLDALGAVQVVSREEGSGTRSVFAELVGFDEAQEENEEVEDGEDVKSGSDTNENTQSSRIDGTTEDALIADSADEVIEAVGEDTAAIGYISMGSLADLTDEKVLAVDGVEGTLANVKNGDYTLNRPFVLAWSGSLNDLEQDFLTYVTGKGQAIVEQSYVTVKESTTFLSGQYKGTITIHSSTSAAPLLEELAAEYMSINTNATVEITVSDSTTGLNDAMQGACSFGAASRELKEYEEELLDYEVIAYDGIAVIVNGENPLDAVTTEELKDLFTGTITNWAEINEGR